MLLKILLTEKISTNLALGISHVQIVQSIDELINHLKKKNFKKS